MYSDRIAAVKSLIINHGGGTGKTKFTRDNLLSKVSLAYKIRHNVNFISVDHIDCFPYGWFLFPKTAMNLAEDISVPNFLGMIKVRCR